MANLYLVNAEDNRYDFPESFWLDDMSYRKTSKIENIAFAHGGKNTADGFLQPRNIIIQGDLRADTLAAFETAERALVKAILAGGKLYVSDDTIFRYITVTEGLDVSYKYIGTYRLEKPFTIAFTAVYPFWQQETENSQDQVVSDGDTFTIDNSGSDTFCYPIITIEADQGADVPSIFLRNNGDGGMTFQYQDANFLQGDVLIIDSYNGTVKRNGNSSIENVILARFPRLQNHDSNIFYYEGADVTITVEWREVYL